MKASGSGQRFLKHRATHWYLQAARADMKEAKLAKETRARIHQRIDELMQAADLVVTKPGGLTTSEVLAREAIMVIVNPIPGQESRNSDYLLENGAAIKANNIATLAYKIDRLLDDAPRLESLRNNVRRIAHPRSAFDVVASSLELIEASGGVQMIPQ